MRTIGVAEKALELMCARAQERVAFGRKLVEFDTIRAQIADARIAIESSRLLCYLAADQMDKVGHKAARAYIAMIKVHGPIMALKVVDNALQVHGAAGVSQTTPLAAMWASLRTLRLADGPDEVHRRTITKWELSKLPSKL
eukprot:TRINITY_DN5142_c0_g1_i1.p1 TRINITY_DN5142_c0_g1~~TRINITY_DN5142_c0_g1_i1.p1  ORF type:complete len:141 (+),score=34.38 TRINITY_DN5142_c0_g1_i1:202-624(+)